MFYCSHFVGKTTLKLFMSAVSCGDIYSIFTSQIPARSISATSRSVEQLRTFLDRKRKKQNTKVVSTVFCANSQTVTITRGLKSSQVERKRRSRSKKKPQKLKPSTLTPSGFVAGCLPSFSVSCASRSVIVFFVCRLRLPLLLLLLLLHRLLALHPRFIRTDFIDLTTLGA